MNTRLFQIFFLTILSLSMMLCADVHAQQILTKDDEKIDFARGLLDQSQFAMAALQYQEFIVQFPQSAFIEDAYLGIAECRFFLKLYDEAIGFYQKYLDQFPEGKNKSIAFVRLGQCLYLTGKFDDALTKLTAVDAALLTPVFAQTLYFYLGHVYFVKENFTAGAVYFEKAVAIDGVYSMKAYLLWGSILFRRADYTAAAEKYVKAFEKATTDEEKVEILMKQGESYFTSENYPIAAETFKKIIESYPSQVLVKDATANWFSSLLKQKQYDELIAQYSQRLTGEVLDASLSAAHLVAAEAFSALGRNDEANVILDKIIALQGVSDVIRNKAQITKALYLVKAERFADALAFIDVEMPKAQGVRAQMLLVQAQSYLRINDYDHAWAAYQTIMQEFPNTSSSLESLCGMAYVRSGQAQFEGAAALFMDCFEKNKDESLRRDALFNAVLMFQKANTVNKAVECAELYLKNYPQGERVADVTLTLSGLYSKLQQYDKATEILKAIANDPDEERRQNGAFQAAYNLQLAGQMDQALAAYDKMISDNKNPNLAYLSLKNSAMIYFQKKDEEKAADALLRAVRGYESKDLPLKNYLWLAQRAQTKNNSQEMLEIVAAARKFQADAPGSFGINYFFAEASRMQNNCPDALKAYDEVMAAPENTVYQGRVHVGRGICLSKNGDYAGAQKELEQAVSENPEDHYVAMRGRFELAQNALLQKDWQQAANLFMVVAVLYKDPDYAPQALLNAGMAFEQLNNKAEAIQAYQQMLSGFPKSPESVKAKELLEKLK